MLDQQARSYKQEYGEYDEYANFKSYIYTNHETLIYEGFYFSARNWIKKKRIIRILRILSALVLD